MSTELLDEPVNTEETVDSPTFDTSMERVLIRETKGLHTDDVAHIRHGLSVLLQAREAVPTSQRTRDALEKIRDLTDNPHMQAFLGEITDALLIPGTAAEKLRAVQDKIGTFGIPDVMNPYDACALGILRKIPNIPIINHIAMYAANKHMIEELEQFFVIGQKHDPLEAVQKMEELYGKKETVNYELNFAAEAAISMREADENTQRYIEAIQAGATRIALKPASLVPFASPAATKVGARILANNLKKIFAAAEGMGRNDKPIPAITIDSENRALYNMINLALEDAAMAHVTVPIEIATQSYSPDSWTVVKDKTLALSKRRLDSSEHAVPVGLRVVCGAGMDGEIAAASMAGWDGAHLNRYRPENAREDGSPLFGEIEETHAHEIALTEDVIEAIKAGQLTITLASMNLMRTVYKLELLKKHDALDPRYVRIAMLHGMPNTELLAQIAEHYGLEAHFYTPYAGKEAVHLCGPYNLRRADELTRPKHAVRAAAENPFGSVLWTQSQVRQLVAALKIKQQNQEQIAYPLPPRFLPTCAGDQPVIDWRDGEFHRQRDINFGHEDDFAWMEEIVESCLAHIENDPEVGKLDDRIVAEDSAYTDLVGPPLKDQQRPTILRQQMAGKESIDKAYDLAINSDVAKQWGEVGNLQSRLDTLGNVIDVLHKNKASLIQSLMLDTGKSGYEALKDVHEGMDFVNLAMLNMQKLLDRGLVPQPEGNGAAVIVCPKNFMAIPMDAVFLRLMAGYRVILKPSGGEDQEAILSMKRMVECFYEAGVPREALVFFPCNDEVADELIADERCERVNYTGSTNTKDTIRKRNPKVEMHAENGSDGGNAMVIGPDVDLRAAAELAAFNLCEYSGRKCSRSGLIVLAKGVDRERFELLLKEALDAMCVNDVSLPNVDCTKLMPGEPTDELMNLRKQESGWVRKPLHPHEPSVRWAHPRLFKPEENGELFGPTATLIQVDGDTKDAVRYAQRAKGSLTFSVVTENYGDLRWARSNITTGNCYLGLIKQVGALAEWCFGDGKGTSNDGFGPTGGLEDIIKNCNLVRRSGEEVPYDKTEVESDRHGLKTVAERLDANLQSLQAAGTIDGFDCTDMDKQWQGLQHALWSYLHEMDTHHSKKRETASQIRGLDTWAESRKIGRVAVRIHDGATLFDSMSKVLAAIVSGNMVAVSVSSTMHSALMQASEQLGFDIAARADITIQSDQEFAADIAADLETGKPQFNRIFTTQEREAVSEDLQQAAVVKGLYIDCSKPTGDGKVDLASMFRVASFVHKHIKYGSVASHDFLSSRGAQLSMGV